MKYRPSSDTLGSQKGELMTRQYRARWFAFLVGLMTCSLVLELLNVAPAVAQGACTPAFTQPTGSPLAAGGGPNAIVSVDMNNDGRADIAVVNGSSGSVSVFLGNGSGGFTQAPGSPIQLGSSPSTIVQGNFNNDAFPDLAVGIPGPNNVAILLGNGDGSFNQNAGQIAVGDAPGGIVVGNFNNDGLVDFAVTGLFANGLRIFLGNGFGGFFLAAGSPIAIPDQPRGIVSGNFNGDGIADLAIVNSGALNSVTILVGNGLGGFTQAGGSPIAVGTTPVALTVGDFNVDGRFDLAVANSVSNSVSILLGAGNGTFSQAAGSPIAGVQNPNGIVTGNFNSDTFEDLAVASTGSNSVVILNGNGLGGFTPTSTGPVTVGQQPFALTSASFNGDPITDFAVANQGSSNVTILIGNCSFANLGVTIADSPDPVTANADVVYTIQVQNAGPDPASNATLSVPTPAGTTFFLVTPPSGWTCTNPGVGSAGTVTCTISTLPVGNANFTLVVRLGAGALVGSTVQTTATVSSASQDPTPGNNTASASTLVTPAEGTCGTRPRVVLTVSKSGQDRLLVTVTSTTNGTIPNNRLNQVNATLPGNARIDVVGGQTDLTGQVSVPVGSGTTPVQFIIRRVAPGSVHVPMSVIDQCGEWKTFAGGGPGAFQ